MRHVKHYCKLLISTIAVVLVFACHSLVSYADPLTGAMMGSALASGFSFPGFAGLSVPSSESIIGDFYTDLVPWAEIVQAAHAYVTIRDLLGSNNVEVELSPEISSAGANRTTQLNSQYGLTPGTVHSFGTYRAVGSYVLDRQSSLGNGAYLYSGPSLGSFPSSHDVGYRHVFSVAPNIFLDSAVTEQYPNSFLTQSVIGSSTSTWKTDSAAVLDSPVFFGLHVSRTGAESLAFYSFSSSWNRLASIPSVSSTGLTITTSSPSIDRDSSPIVNPSNQANSIVIPSSYLSGVSYTSGETIYTLSDVEATLDAISTAGFNGDVVSSDYVDPVDPPAPSGDSIADTPYSTLNDVFTEFKEFFGDIYDGISAFHESFGDWVDNIASGWTEVFGDIFSDLHDFKEAFGDWVNDVASGWTEIFGDIYSTVSGIASTVSGTIANTLSGIATAVQSLVQTIENADFQFIEGFWKNFLTPFTNLFNTIKSHLSIWHYVVEWLSSISGVFTFFLGVFSGAGSGFLLPIYATFAGTVVIAVYRRFGK